jgi:transcriptional regulator with XRE-family HTH domain
LHRKLTLRQLADRMNAGAAGHVTSYASVARIERGLQPYTQPTLEAAATALHVPPAALLSINPQDGDDIISLWDALDPERRQRALAVLRAIQGAP